MPHKISNEQIVPLLRGLVEQIEPEVRQNKDVPKRILNLLGQPSLTRNCCAEILAYHTFPDMDHNFHTLKSALISGALKDAEVKKLILKLPDDKSHFFEPLLGIRAFDFFEISQMSSIPFHIFFQTLKTHSEKTLPGDLCKLYHRIPESERTPENQQKLGDVAARLFLIKTIRFSEHDENAVRSLQHLLQHLPEWKPKK